ncbi:uncharacterized protein LOC119586540 [Penaeus monodon]|uniref:uncharacterized protein LOC119586540 n=1 Tax=Penaeus monodon TaxID=6687 RepID=UPI0018A7C0A2|nr:uncharacterized protein LOC119586540 [Penaeus monodon]
MCNGYPFVTTRGVVILNKCDYQHKLLNILSDRTKFKRITIEVSTHLLYLEDKLKRLLRTIKSSINENTYNFLSTSGSRPGLLYGLPKVHKPNIPLRPIISSIGTFNYNTAKFLVPIISPLTANQYTIENSTSFANEITTLNFKQPTTMASFDIESLFTNVPLHETTDIIVNNVDTSQLTKIGLTKDNFKKLLDLAAHHSVFTFDDCLYTQTDGETQKHTSACARNPLSLKATRKQYHESYPIPSRYLNSQGVVVRLCDLLGSDF